MNHIPLAFAPDIIADPATAALMNARVARGEITPDQIRAILGDTSPPVDRTRISYGAPIEDAA